MLLEIHPTHPDERKIKMVIDCLKNGGIIVYPTDTIYGIGCDIYNQKAVERVCKLKGINPEKNNLSIICNDLSHISDYTKPINNKVFRIMKNALPGAYTFILQANNSIPKLFKNKKQTIGIRVPNNTICLAIVKELGNPIMTTSIHDNDDVIEYTTDPELIYERYKDQVDMVINGGYGDNQASTVLDCSGDTITVLREGKGDLTSIGIE